MYTTTINGETYELEEFGYNDEVYTIMLKVDENHTHSFDQLFDTTVRSGEELLQVKIDIPARGISGLFYIESLSRTGRDRYTSIICFVKHPRI